MDIRTIKSLADELGVCERQFHRRVDQREPEALRMLAEEILDVHSSELTSAAGAMKNAATTLRRCSPDMSALLDKLGTKLERLVNDTPQSKWRLERARRLDLLADYDGLSDDVYQQFVDTAVMPPTLEELKIADDKLIASILAPEPETEPESEDTIAPAELASLPALSDTPEKL